jgi:anti-sigma regulatory factor (Ser/Thr protein kinase)
MEPLIVPATLDALEVLTTYILKAAGEAGLDEKSTSRLRLAVDELATNICLHGYAVNTGTLRLQAFIDRESLNVEMEDTGPAFDPREAIPPDLNLPPEDRPIGGLGIYFATRSVDSFAYERVGNLNRSTLTMKRTA